MMTGRQIREARLLLKWGKWRLAKAAHLPMKTLIRAESVDDDAPVTMEQKRRITDVLERSGVELLPDNGVRLRQSAEIV